MASVSDQEEQEDLSLRVYIWDQVSNHDPRIERLPADQWGAAIDRARDLAWGAEPLSRTQVIDAYGMLVAQFTSKHLILPPHMRDRDG